MNNDQIKQIEDELAEVTEQEYLEEMQRMLPLVKGSKRLAHLLAYVKQANIDFDVEKPAELVARFIDDMDILSGKKQIN